MNASSQQQPSLFSKNVPHQETPGIEFIQGRTLGLPRHVRIALARSFISELIRHYWRTIQERTGFTIPFKPFKNAALLKDLLVGDIRKAQELGEGLANLPSLEAGYRIGCIYTAGLPDQFRSELGVFYTPPALCQRIIELVTDAGIDWSAARVLDPACGGAAFLAPVALKMAQALDARNVPEIVQNISSRLLGFEIDPFAAWISQTLVEATLAGVFRDYCRRLPEIASVRDSLSESCDGQETFDLVVGNPPYGRMKLSPSTRRRFERGLYGHANAYGLFTDRAVSWAKPGGIVAFVTPTGMLGGQYFKNLRRLLSTCAPPLSIDFVTSRSRVFADVLQETMLAVYRVAGERRAAKVSFIDLVNNGAAKVTPAGLLTLPDDVTQPWLIPRKLEQSALTERLGQMMGRISDYGYRVSTGPLVWNRHKGQFGHARTRGAYPVVWAESVVPGCAFKWRAEKRSHLPWLKPAERDRWVLTNRPCVLVQRTTAKEQHRRLIAAELPPRFISEHKLVAIENHLNMIWAERANPAVSAKFVAALLNSAIVDSAFRCINGSVAVSAYELEALPMPSVDDAKKLESMLLKGLNQSKFEEAVWAAYMGTKNAAASVA